MQELSKSLRKKEVKKYKKYIWEIVSLWISWAPSSRHIRDIV